MCGIAGYCGGLDGAQLKKMNDAQAHRGPDGEGVFVDDGIGLGHRRLTIIDTTDGGAQPMHSQDGRYVLVFNGEIYNYQELKKELETTGQTFTSNSDTEVILIGFEQWGKKVVEKLLGMFSFAIYDMQTKELFIARDRLGIKPLYYITQPEFAFASEIKALMTIPGVTKRVHTETLAKFLKFRVHDSDEQTFFDGVKRLLPGHYMTIKNGEISIEQYWKLEWNSAFKSEKSDDEYAKEFADLYQKVIKRHMLSDVSLGFNLSGGLDSSGVVSVAAELLRQGEGEVHTKGKMYTFSALFPNQSIDESEYINEVEKSVGSTPVYSYPKPDEFWNEINQWVYMQEEPTISSAPYAYYSVFREASKHVKVSLSGNGGDEILAGYLPYFRTYVQSALDSKQYLRAGAEIIRGIPQFYHQYIDRIAMVFQRPSQTIVPFLGEKLEGYRDVKFGYSRNLNERLSQDVTRYSTPNLLRYEDKNSMAFGLESRVPFLDSELVEFVFSLPIDQKIKKGWTRYVYRNAMKGHMPELNRLRRSKIGFTNPEVSWMHQNAEGIRGVFAGEHLTTLGLFNQKELLESFDRWLEGKERIDPLVYWRVLVTQLWAERYELEMV